MPYYHVLASLSSDLGKVRTILSDLTEEQLLAEFVIPYRRGQNLFLNGEIVVVSTLNKVILVKTEKLESVVRKEINEQDLRRMQEFNRSPGVVLISAGGGYEAEDILEGGENVTKQFIHGVPGYEPVAAEAPRSNNGIEFSKQTTENSSNGHPQVRSFQDDPLAAGARNTAAVPVVDDFELVHSGESKKANKVTGFESPLVITLHGIRTRGKWQKELVPFLEEKGFRTRPLDYDWFGAWSFLVPALRKEKISWLEEKLSEHKCPISIIAHSFGSYLICKVLVNSTRIKVDTIILCGSIVKRDFPWGDLIDSGRVKRVLNDFGTRDIYAGFVGHVVGDAGDSGKVGFDSTRITQRKFLNWSHSEFFKAEIYKDWSDFLSGDSVGTPRSPEHPTMGWLLRLFVLIGIVLICEFVTRPVPIDESRDRSYWVRSSELIDWENGKLTACDSVGFVARPAWLDIGRSIGDGAPLYTERVEVVDVFSSIWSTDWSRVRAKIKPIELDGFQTLYTYEYRDSCKGYFLAKGNVWREWTPSDSGESCINTNFVFSERLRDTEYVYLKRIDGMMIRIPYVKGYSQIESVGGADFSNHYLTTPRFCKNEFGPRGPIPDLAGNGWQYGGVIGSGSIVQMHNQLQITLTWNVSGNYAQYTIDAVLSEKSAGKFVFEGAWNKAGFAPGYEGTLEGEVISNDRIRINKVTGGEIASISNLEGMEVFRVNK